MEQQQHVLVIQHRGRVVTDYKNWHKVCITMPIFQISTHKYGSGHFDPFKHKKNSSKESF